jgi:hypothetical protein
MKTIEKMNQIEVGAYVQTYLRKKGIDVVLSGGAAVTYYSNNQYISKDLDMIRTGLTGRIEIKKVMAEIGFMEMERYFKHPLSEYFVEFPEGPLTVGNEPLSIGDTSSIDLDTGTLRILSPTDCVKDRLASYYHYQDQQGLNQAIMVAKSNKVDMEDIKYWSKNEGKSDEFDKILTRFKF